MSYVTMRCQSVPVHVLRFAHHVFAGVPDADSRVMTTARVQQGKSHLLSAVGRARPLSAPELPRISRYELLQALAQKVHGGVAIPCRTFQTCPRGRRHVKIIQHMTGVRAHFGRWILPIHHRQLSPHLALLVRCRLSPAKPPSATTLSSAWL